MANKPVIDIDVNADQFKQFYELFQEYHAKLEAMPSDWKKVDAATKKAATAFGAISGAAAGSFDVAVKKAQSLTKEVNKSTVAQKQFHKAARSSASELKKMATFAGSTAKHVFGLGKYLFKIGALGGGIGILGGFGLRELGESAVSSQRTARGLGISIGNVKAYGSDFQRILDPSILSHIANQQNSYQGRVWLGMSTGINPMQVANMRPDQVSERLMLKAHDWWKNTPSAMRTTENMQARGFMQSGLTLEDMRRLGATHRSTILSAQAKYNKDSKSLNLSESTVRAWFAFTNALSIAGKKIETTLTARLSALAPVLGSFVNSLTKDAEALINSVLTPKNLDKAAAEIKEFATYLGSKQTLQDIKDFGAAIVDVTHLILKVAGWFGELPGVTTTKTEHPLVKLSGKTKLSELQNHPAGYKPKMSGGIKATGPFLPTDNPYNYKIDKYKGLFGGESSERTYMGPDYYKKNPAWPGYRNPRVWVGNVGQKYPNKAQAAPVLAGLEKQYELPTGILTGVYGAESSYGRNSGISPAGAAGPFQFMPKTAKAYGITNPSSFSQESVGAARKMADLLREYHGDAKKAAAAYNWGDGNLNKDIAAHGKKWEAYAPKETRDYVGKVVSHIILTNKTGSSVAHSANALGQ